MNTQVSSFKGLRCRDCSNIIHVPHKQIINLGFYFSVLQITSVEFMTLFSWNKETGFTHPKYFVPRFCFLTNILKIFRRAFILNFFVITCFVRVKNRRESYSESQNIANKKNTCSRFQTCLELDSLKHLFLQ